MLPVCSLQCGPRDAVKDRLYDQLRTMPAIAPASAVSSHMVIVMSTEAEQALVLKRKHGNNGYDRPVQDIEGERILEYALAYDLLLCNKCLKK